MAVEKIDLTCPKCGGNMERDTARKLLHCPYCGHEEMLQSTDTESVAARAYARQRGILLANQEAEKAAKRRKRKGILIAIGVILALFLAAGVYNALRPKVDPFAYITVSFSGTTGEGTAEVVLRGDAPGGIDPHSITYRVEPRNWLSEGDRVTVTASCSDYPLYPTSKTYLVTGLDTYLTDLAAFSEKAERMIHNKSDMTVRMDIEGIGVSLNASSAEPCVMYLTTDGKNGNTLYDIFKVLYPEKDGGFAERYVVVYYSDVIVRDTDEPTMSYNRTMYTGQVIETLDRGYGGYVTGYKSLKDAKADILSHQSAAVTLQERESLH